MSASKEKRPGRILHKPLTPDQRQAVASAREKEPVLKENFGGQAGAVHDEDQLFLLYATHCGDTHKTAHTAGLPHEAIVALAEHNHWEERLRGLVELKSTDKAVDIERGVSAAMCFAQAHRYRIFLERILRQLYDKNDEELMAMILKPKMDKTGMCVGHVFDTKPFADLATAMEKVHWVLYQSLRDSPQERAKRLERPDSDLSESDIHARIVKGLSEMRGESVPLVLLHEAQDSMAADILKRATRPPNKVPITPPPGGWPCQDVITGKRLNPPPVEAADVKPSTTAIVESTTSGEVKSSATTVTGDT